MKDLVLTMIINHIWNGGIPNFINIEIIIIKHAPLSIISLIINEDKNRIDAHLCTKKYFIPFSIDRLPSDDIVGKNLKRFNSNENQTNKIDSDLTEIIKEEMISK